MSKPAPPQASTPAEPSGTPKQSNPPNLEGKLFAALASPKLPRWLFGLTLLLSSSALFSGYRLDDYIARYIYDDSIPGSQGLFEVLSGGYGVARGDVLENQWLVQSGWAPWWIKDDLLIRLYRPIGVLSHQFDAALWPDNAPLAHAHSLLLLGLLVLALTYTYRTAMGPLLGGMAALLFALDHTHGFTVGYICNRHALIGGIFAALCLGQHMRYRKQGSVVAAVLAPVCLVGGLLTSESTVAIVGYVGAFALFADRGSLFRRGLTLVPYLAIVIIWRTLYRLGGYGAHGSGMYLDPAAEPIAFLAALLERGPVLLLGQYLAPPAEAYVMVGPQGVPILVACAVAFVGLLGVGLYPLLKRSQTARFWALGSLLSMVPAASAYPHNRQLLFVSFGAMALVGELWHLHGITLKNAPPSSRTPLIALSGAVGAVVLFAHLIISPLALPLTSFSAAFTAPLHRAIDDVGDEIVGREAIFITSPDYFPTKLIQLDRRIRGALPSKRMMGLSFGPEAVTVLRSGEKSLTLYIEGGILTDHILELYRDSRTAMEVGPVMQLSGVDVTIEHLASTGLPDQVRFDFARPLEADRYRFYFWRSEGGFAPFDMPDLGQKRTLPPATLDFSL